MLERKKIDTAPHVAIVRFNIFIHRVLPDGSYDPQIIDCKSEFQDYEMTNSAEIVVTGFDKWNCIKNVKEKLESLNG
jgi:hypothetical protein